MKLNFLIIYLFLSVACRSQSLLDKPLRLERQKGSVAEFLDDLNRQPGIIISYSSQVVDLTRVVQLGGPEKNLGDFLRTILRGQRVKFIEQNEKIFLVPDDRVRNKITINGYITDRKSGERLIGSSIFIPSLQIGTTSNTYGFFSITVPQDTLRIQVTYAGYLPWMAYMAPGSDLELHIEMDRDFALNELVVVNAEAKQRTQNRTLVGKTAISASFIKSVSALMGEPDVLKTLQLLPGIQEGNEGTSGLVVRGGSMDQNLILLDGAPVYNASHIFGLFSIFNADAINNVEVYKSGMPASYGGRLSSVVDVHMREGDKYDFHGEGGIGLILSKLSIEGPIKKGKSSFLVAGRRSYADVVMRGVDILNGNTTTWNPFFGDLNVKTNFPLGSRDRIYFSFYTGRDKLTFKEKESYQRDSSHITSKYNAGFSWGNITAMTRWNHVFSKKLFSNFTFSYSRYQFTTWEKSDEISSNPASGYRDEMNYFSGIRDWSVRADLDFLPAPQHFVKAGISAAWHRYRPGVNHFLIRDDVIDLDQRIDKQSISSTEFDAWIEDDIKVSRKIKTNIGVRFSVFSVRNKTFSLFQPRFNGLYRLDERWSLKTTFGITNQFIHLLTNNGLGLPTDLWLPVTDRIPPQSAAQVTLGASYEPDQSLVYSMEAYYKRLKNVIEYTEGSMFYNAYDNWEDAVQTGLGKTYGIEWLVQKKKGVLTGIVSYTLSKSSRHFRHINGGKEFPFTYDRRHEFKTALVWRPSKRFEAGANWVISSGKAISLPSGWYFDPEKMRYIDIYDSRNNFRMPVYHRLDLSLRFIKQKRKYLRTWVISVYNVYNRLNPFYMQDATSHDPDKVTYESVALFPFLPSISYQFKF